MGLLEFLRQWQGSRHATGVTVSLLVHAALILAFLIGNPLSSARQGTKPGDALIVELPSDPQPSAAGSAGTPAPTPAPRPAAPPAPRASAPARPAARPVPSRPAVERQSSPAPRVASQRPPEPVTPDPSSVAPAPALPRPAEPSPSETAARPADDAPGSREAQSPRAAQRQVASVPPGSNAPSGQAYVPDVRSLRRGSGAGGVAGGAGRGGVEGDPISLDTADPKYGEYLSRVKLAIERNMVWPCIKSADGSRCEPRRALVVIDFGIRKNGDLAFIEVRRPSAYQVMDDVSQNAVKLAAFPPMPDDLRRLHPTGLPITANFVYDFSLRWVLH